MVLLKYQVMCYFSCKRRLFDKSFKKAKCVSITIVSSNEVIRAILDFLDFNFTSTKSTKRLQANKNKKYS